MGFIVSEGLLETKELSASILLTSTGDSYSFGFSMITDGTTYDSNSCWWTKLGGGWTIVDSSLPFITKTGSSEWFWTRIEVYYLPPFIMVEGSSLAGKTEDISLFCSLG